jgi:predicted ribosome quality control (RQC) complex YloA/Tae2 family protein
MDIQLSNLALSHLVEELKFLENGFVNNVQSLENGWMKIKVHTKTQGDKQLVIAPNAVFVSNYSLQAKQNPGGFSALLKKYLDNQRILSIKQHGVDRIVLLEFMELFLVLELFAKGNLVLCNKSMEIIKAMRKEEWKDRKLEQFAKYRFPSSKGINPLEETLAGLEKKLKESSKSFFGASVDALNASPLILEHAFNELGLDKKKDSKNATEKESKALLEKVQEIYLQKNGKAYLHGGVIYSTEIGKEHEQEFESINAALNSLLFNDSGKAEIKIIEKPPAVEKKKAEKYEKDRLAKLNQIAGLEVKEKEAQKKGEEIYLHYNEIKEIFAAIEKAKKRGLSEKEIVEKINSVKPVIKGLNFKENKVTLKL